jgi:hypothetical protein
MDFMVDGLMLWCFSDDKQCAQIGTVISARMSENDVLARYLLRCVNNSVQYVFYRGFTSAMRKCENQHPFDTVEDKGYRYGQSKSVKPSFVEATGKKIS